MNGTRALVLVAALLLGGCFPSRPTVTAVGGRAVDANRSELTMEATLEGDNPNDFDIEIRSLTAKLTLDGKYDIGTATSSQAIVLTAKKRTTFVVSLPVKWLDAAPCAKLALSRRDVPFEATGIATARAKSSDHEVPFTVKGIITHEQIVRAAGRVLPGLHRHGHGD